MSKALISGLILLFCSPIFYIFYKFGISINFLSLNGLTWALKNTLMQGVLTSLLGIFLGVVLSWGLFRARPSILPLLRTLCYIPLMLPSIFSVLVALNLLPFFPYGHWGVIFIYLLIYTGYCTFFVFDTTQKKIQNMGFLSEVYNLKQVDFIFKIYLPLIKSELFALGIFIFSCTATSLTVPMMAGGGRGTNLEVFLYEKIYIDAAWSAAAVVLMIHLIAMLILSLFVRNADSSSDNQDRYILNKYLGSKTSLVLLMACVGVYLLPISVKLLIAAFEIEWSEAFVKELIFSIQGSIAVFMGSSLLFLAFIYLMGYLHYMKAQVSYLRGFQNISAVVVGFASLIFWSKKITFLSYFSLLYCMAFIYFLSLYFSFFDPILKKMNNQFFTAQVYNIKYRSIFRTVIWPQIAEVYSWSLGLLGLISLMDFVYVYVSGATYQTLGTLFENYLTSYRMSYALVIALVAIFLWMGLYFLLRLAYVDHKKS